MSATSVLPLRRRVRPPFRLAALLLAPLCAHAAAPQGRPVQSTGTVTVVTLDDFAHHTSRLEYQLEDENSHRHALLRFDGAAPEGLQTGARVQVVGIAGREGEIQLSSESVSMLASPAMQSATATGAASSTMQSATAAKTGSPTMLTATATTTASATVVSGVQNTIVIIANFTNATVSSTPSQIQDLMFSDPTGHSIDALFRETSFGNVGFSGQVAGPFTINYSTSSPCDLASWADAADAAATASGISLSSYPRRLYVMPSTEMSVCGADGSGQVGGSPSRAWVFNYTVNDVYAHELGHNLNMAHASTLANTYGDASDDMSASGYPLRHFNAPHMEQMGWMPSGNIATVTASGTYTVAALETSPSQAPAPQILKIFKPDTGDYYYLSYREALGFDSGLRTAYFNRVHVHKYAGNYASYSTYLLALLDDTSVFSDTTNAITVTQVSHATDRATVQIQLPSGGSTGTCQRAAPVLSLSPSSQSGNAGSTLSYSVSLTNKDNSYCTASSFSLAGVVPSGWAGAVSPATLSLSPGASGSATLSVTSPSTASAATYSATVNVSDAATTTHSVSGSVSYVVQTTTSCTRAAPALAFSPTSRSGYAGSTQSYSVSVTNKDSSACPASTLSLGGVIPSGWSAGISPATMSLSPGATSSATFTVTSTTNAAAATYTVQLTTSDTATTTHASSSSGSDVVQADTQAPSAPTGLTASVSKRTNVSLSWTASTDNVGVAGYEVWRNGVRIATVTKTAYAESLTAGTYSYYVVAYDAAGNRSSASNTVSVQIKAH